MSLKCAIIPLVRNKQGQQVDSGLFKDLLSAFGRDKAKDIYQRTKTEVFREMNSDLQFDQNGEPTFESLSKRFTFEMDSKKGSPELINELNGFTKNGRPIKMQMTEALNKANEYNKNNKETVAIVDGFRDGFMVSVQKSDAENISKSKSQLVYQLLAANLKEALSRSNIDVGLINETEKLMGINGVTDFSSMQKIGEGLLDVIRVANNQEGIKAIPEEFAHFSLRALSDHPLVQRFLNIVDSKVAKEVLGDQYDEYLLKYKFDETRVNEEAAGKLVAKHLFQLQEIKPSKYSMILLRVLETIKGYFRRIDPTSVNKAIKQAEMMASEISNGLLYLNLTGQYNLRSIDASGQLFSLASLNDAYKKILEQALHTEIKRFNIYKNRTKDSKFTEDQKIRIALMAADIENKVEESLILGYINDSIGKLNQLNQRLLMLKKDGMSIEEKARILRNIDNYLYSYGSMIKFINELEAEYLNEERTILSEETRGQLAKLSLLNDQLKSQYEKAAMPIFVEFIGLFTGSQRVGKELLTSIMETADRDIGFFDRWLDAMSSSADQMGRLMALAVNKSKELSRLQTIEVLKRLTAAHTKLEQAGVKNTEFMFNKDADGNPTGNYIQEIDYDRFYSERRAYSELIKKGLDYESREGKMEYSKKMRQWNRDRTHSVDGRFIPNDEYKNPRFKNMSKAQREYYDEFMDIKEMLDSFLPSSGVKPYKAVQIRKDLLERVKSSKSVSDGTKQIWDAIKYSFINSADDVEFATKSAIKDFKGNLVHTLPVYFTKRLESKSELSMDATSTLLAYASMANDYNEMNKVINTLEIGRDLLTKRKVIQTSGSRLLMESIKGFGKDTKSPISKSGNGTNVVDRLNDFFQMLVYGRYINDEGNLWNTQLSKAKIADQINKATAINSMALNVLSGFANISMGKVMMRIEAMAGEFFKYSDVVWADKTYGRDIMQAMGQIGARVKSNKLDLWNEMFNVLLKHEEEARGLDMDKKGAFVRHANTGTLMFLLNSGEHWMQTRTSLALANQYKMRAPTGQLVSLYDAFEVVKLMEGTKVIRADLKLKEGYTKADGTPFTSDDVITFAKKSKKINQKMHGIYNKMDKNALLKLALGRMAMLFRKWLPEAYNRRMQTSRYDYDLDAEQEGYYRTLGRFLKGLYQDMKQSQFDIATKWKDMSDHEKANMKRSMTEMGTFVSIVAVCALLGGYDDKDRKSWAVSMLEYQLFRLKMELGALTPTPAAVFEVFNIINSPAAGVRTVQDYMRLVDILNPMAWTTDLKTGKYKDHSRAYRNIMEVLPMNRTLHKVANPEEASVFFKL